MTHPEQENSFEDFLEDLARSYEIAAADGKPDYILAEHLRYSLHEACEAGQKHARLHKDEYREALLATLRREVEATEHDYDQNNLFIARVLGRDMTDHEVIAAALGRGQMRGIVLSLLQTNPIDKS